MKRRVQHIIIMTVKKAKIFASRLKTCKLRNSRKTSITFDINTLYGNYIVVSLPKLLTDSFPFRGNSYWSKSYCQFHRLGRTREGTFLNNLEIGTQQGIFSSEPRTCVSCNYQEEHFFMNSYHNILLHSGTHTHYRKTYPLISQD